MLFLRKGTLRGRKLAAWAVFLVGGVSSIGCQVEYAGMTLPTGKYMRDDVQYFAPGPNFPWANTQAATQRARMAAQGMTVPNEEVAPGSRRSYENLGGAAPSRTSTSPTDAAGVSASTPPAVPAPPVPQPPSDAPAVPAPF